MNKKTVALTTEQYKDIITTIQNGFLNSRPNAKVATVLILEANLGLRLSDILALRLDDIVRDADRYRLDIVEQKTNKKRTFTVPQQIYLYIQDYCLRNDIKPNQQMFDISARTVQDRLKKACDYLNYQNISTHSFRKFFATQIYINNNYNIALVQQLLQHSSVATTQRYIKVSAKEIDDALNKHIVLI